MRKGLALILVAYWMALFSPFLALADSTLPGMCPFGVGNGSGIPEGTLDAAGLKQTYETWSSQFSEDLSTSECENATTDSEKATCQDQAAARCGVDPNDVTHYLEKGDCTAAGLIVTEVNEVITPDVTLDTEKKTDKVVTVYSGLCCLLGETKDGNVTSCEDTRTLYTKSYSDCTAVAENCEKRQWVIGSSGINLVKLVVKQIFTFAALAVGSVAVGTIVLQGIRISVSGVSGDITEAKNKILQAIAGMVLLFLSGLILYAINPGFFGSS